MRGELDTCRVGCGSGSGEEVYFSVHMYYLDTRVHNVQVCRCSRIFTGNELTREPF